MCNKSASIDLDFIHHKQQLLGSSYKTVKGETRGYLTGILYLLPYNLSGVNLCSHASPGCASDCLNTAGRGAMNCVQRSRARKSAMFLYARDPFKTQLRKDILALDRKAKRKNMVPCVRLNGTSDIAWESVCPEIFQEFSHIQFYDYTKNPNRMARKLPQNYHLTFSRSEVNHEKAMELTRPGSQRGNGIFWQAP